MNVQRTARLRRTVAPGGPCVAPHVARSRGVALLLVVIALAVATILALTFLASQSTTIGIARNLDRHARARQIAESGLAIAMREVAANPGWRTDHAHGTWVANQPYAGGTFTIVGHDGADLDGDGLVSIPAGEGDGNLADDEEDPLTLTVTGTFDGVTHRVRALATATSTGDEPSPGGAYAVAATGQLTVINGTIDAIDSSKQNYSPWGAGNSSALIGTNVIGANQINLSWGATIKGTIAVGPEANPDTVIYTPPWMPRDFSTATIPETFDLPAVQTPPGLPSSVPWSPPNWGEATLAAGAYRYTKLTLSGSFKLKISGKVVMYLDGDFRIDGGASLELLPGAELDLYARSFAFVGGGSTTNGGGAPKPSALRLYQHTPGTFTVDGGAKVAALVYAPNVDFNFPNGRFFGTFAGRSLSMNGGSRFTQDLAAVNLIAGAGGGGGSGGGSGGGGYAYHTRWIEGP